MGLQKEKLLDVVQVTEVSTTTGEAFTYEKNIYDKEIHQANVEYKLSEKELHQYINEEIGSFFFLFYRKLDELDMKEQHKARFIYLASFLDYDSNNIIDKVNGKKLGITTMVLKDYLGLKDTEFKATIKSLRDNGLLIKEKMYYRLNTDYCFKGTVNKKNDYTRVFVDTIKNLYINTKPIHHKQLYYFFKLLPCVNLQFNIITKDVKEETSDNIKPMSMKDICEYLNVNIKDSKKMFNTLNRFMIGDEYVICKHVVHNMDAYSINPKLYYMGTQINNLLAIINLFEMAKGH